MSDYGDTGWSPPPPGGNRAQRRRGGAIRAGTRCRVCGQRHASTHRHGRLRLALYRVQQRLGLRR